MAFTLLKSMSPMKNKYTNLTSPISQNTPFWNRTVYISVPKGICEIDLFSDPHHLNTLRPRQDERHFADDIFTCIFFNENCCIMIKFSLKYARKGRIDNNPALVQIMAWRRSGDEPLSESMMISLPTHICVTRPQ